MNRSKRTGSKWARDWCAFIAEVVPGVERRVDGGRLDRGDVAGLADWAIEAKARKELDLAGALTEAETERRNAGARWCAAAIKRRNHTVATSYVVLPAWVFREILVELERRERG